MSDYDNLLDIPQIDIGKDLMVEMFYNNVLMTPREREIYEAGRRDGRKERDFRQRGHEGIDS